MMIVNQILQTKGHDVWAISPDTPVVEALQVMAQKRIGALLVMEEGQVQGIFSERDYARKVVLEGRSATDTPVGEIMTAKVFYVRPDNTVEDCMAIMTEKRIRHLPVFAGDHLVGVISIGDVVKAMISDREFMIEQLVNYIEGRRSAVVI
ncbi:MAG: CBS domain-containing protein [Chloroflexi bacterium]|nr:CBS domain-containing protein [Chloroflexota bacterium]MCI0576415.1 CBS domain-containing protein [Chloroflexota bacterium]MCI0644287.1 CBS domain-containing protein [Chloroflexota bacterium]MCI0726270.1 CBS domain-containing protein [Chloroflexota bacterium]